MKLKRPGSVWMLANIWYYICKNFVILICVLSIIKIYLIKLDTHLTRNVPQCSVNSILKFLRTNNLRDGSSTNSYRQSTNPSINILSPKWQSTEVWNCFDISERKSVEVSSNFDICERKSSSFSCDISERNSRDLSCSFEISERKPIDVSNSLYTYELLSNSNLSSCGKYCKSLKKCNHGLKYILNCTYYPTCRETTNCNGLIQCNSGVYSKTWSDREKSDDTYSVSSPLAVAAAQNLPDFTTESGIFTGLPESTTPTRRPLADFEIFIEEPLASFVLLKITWKSFFEVKKIRLRHTDQDDTLHTVEIPVNLTGPHTKDVYGPHSSRKGFLYRLGNLYGRRRYYLQSWATLSSDKELYTTLSFLTDEKDGDDRMYNLNGIFLVLGISTIIMVVVLICVGYEKFLTQKKDLCQDFLLCRRKISPAPMKVPMEAMSTGPVTVDAIYSGPQERDRISSGPQVVERVSSRSHVENRNSSVQSKLRDRIFSGQQAGDLRDRISSGPFGEDQISLEPSFVESHLSLVEDRISLELIENHRTPDSQLTGRRSQILSIDDYLGDSSSSASIPVIARY